LLLHQLYPVLMQHNCQAMPPCYCRWIMASTPPRRYSGPGGGSFVSTWGIVFMPCDVHEQASAMLTKTRLLTHSCC
jgi:hypothetical protein